MSSIPGKLVTETFAYDGGRQVTAYIPPAPPEAVVFAGDGQLIAPWGGVLEAPTYRPRSSSAHTGWTMRRCGSMSTHRAGARPRSL